MARYFQKNPKRVCYKRLLHKRKNAYVLKCSLNNLEIEIAVYDDEDKNSFSTIKKIIWNNLELPTPPLPVALEFYKKINRPDKVKLIESFLSTSNSRKQEK